MKKLSYIAVGFLAICGGAFAQTKKVTTPKEIACAVMPSHKVNIATATKTKMFADYKGKRYFFCCGDCKPAFKKNPAKYAKGASIATPKTKKA